MKIEKKLIMVIVLCIIVMVLVIFSFMTIQKMKIIQDLEVKRSQYSDIQNYYLKQESYTGGPKVDIELWKKDTEVFWRITSIYADNHRNITKRYTDGTITNSYYEEQVDDQITKEAVLGEKGNYLWLGNIVFDCLHTENSWKLFRACSFCSIKTETVNGKECYKISNFHPDNSTLIPEGDSSIYIDKKTGLVVRQMTGEIELDTGERIQTYQDFEYKFNCVTEKDLVEPDITGYTVIN